MSPTINTAISISKALFDQAQILAQHLHISPDYLVQLAIEDFIKTHPLDNPPTPREASKIVIRQGDIYWIQLETLNDLESRIPHPYVVIQDNLLNQSRISTVVVCGLTSNLKRANTPGNVLLEVGEANLPKQSIIEVSKVSTVDKTQLGEYIGSLSEQRINQIFAGMRFLQQSFFTRD